MEKLEGGGQDVKGLVALAGELDPLEGAHCEDRPAQCAGGWRFSWIKENHKESLSLLRREIDLKCVTFHWQSGHLASSFDFTSSTA